MQTEITHLFAIQFVGQDSMDMIATSIVGNANQELFVTMRRETAHKDVRRTGIVLDVMVILKLPKRQPSTNITTRVISNIWSCSYHFSVLNRFT